jgi:glycine hydroxymethyltransferase
VGVVAASDILEFGSDNARTSIANARALAAAMAERKAAVHGPPKRGYTLSHHVVLRAAEYGGGTTASRRLERANLLTSGIGLPLPDVLGSKSNLQGGPARCIPVTCCR